MEKEKKMIKKKQIKKNVKKYIKNKIEKSKKLKKPKISVFDVETKPASLVRKKKYSTKRYSLLRDDLLQYQKEYNEKNKERITEYKKQYYLKKKSLLEK